MKIAYIIFDGITWLDLIGIYDALSRLKSGKYLDDFNWDVCSYHSTATDVYGLQMNAGVVRKSLSDYDAIVVPGGHGTRDLIKDEAFLNWIRTAEPVPYKISICTGSLILGAAGYLQSKRATTNYNEYETLRPYCSEVVKERIVEDGKVITAGAVSASIDLGLHLCELWAGKQAREEIQVKMNHITF
ncbi:MAG: DJ-1/PfpI family protein [Chitinophagaceae bacterium]|nr:MAG: DJ-1/PfpI family protein [Chitinophagaceae bacterium]